jgi:hypothetical protein
MSINTQTPEAIHKGKTTQSLAWSSCDPFIIATDKDSIKPDGHGRRFIRHYVMKGKNGKRIETRPSAPKSWINRGNGFSESATRVCPQMNVSPSLFGLGAGIDSYMLQDAYKCMYIFLKSMSKITDFGTTTSHQYHAESNVSR